MAITESFNTADAGTLGPDLSWTELFGAWSVFTNKAALSGSADGQNRARADTDLGSADHYVQVVMSTPTGGISKYHGPACRMPSDATVDFYSAVAGDGLQYLLKNVGGTQTTLQSASASLVANDVWKLSANGTAIKGFVNGVEITSVTDAAIGGNVRGGMVQFASDTVGILDTWEGGTLGGGGGSAADHQLINAGLVNRGLVNAGLVGGVL